MHKVLVLAAALSLPLSACAADNALTTTALTTTEVTTTEVVDTESTSTGSTSTGSTTAADGDLTPAEEAYLDLVQETLRLLPPEADLGADDLTDDQLIEIGQQFCDGLERGTSTAMLTIEVASASGVSPLLVGAIAAAATEELCPQQTGIFGELGDIDPNDTDAIIISTVRFAAGDEFVESFGEEEVVALATRACGRLEEGEALSRVVLSELNAAGNADPENVGVAIGAGIGVLCPQFLGDVEDLVGE